jgi:CBS domain-containing membrane protein
MGRRPWPSSSTPSRRRVSYRTPLPNRLIRWLRTFQPLPMKVDARERARVVIGALFGIGLAALLGHWIAGDPVSVWLIAPMGASAVLVFGVPASPMAQPWAVVGGNTVAAAVGIACVHVVPDIHLAAALAVSLAIGVMFLLGCLHPPGGASALLMVLTQTHDPSAILFPVLFNAVALTAAGVLYNTLTGRAYPHALAPPPTPNAPASRFSEADLDLALSRFNQVLNVSRDDLEQLLNYAEGAAYDRSFGELRCVDIMSRDPAAVEYGTPLEEAWTIMRLRRIKALPVVDKARRVIGIITTADFMRLANLDRRDGLAERLRAAIRSAQTTHSDKPEAVGQIMARQVRVASDTQPVTELVSLFSREGHHHIPVIDGNQKLVGIITQSDLVKSLYRAVKS